MDNKPPFSFGEICEHQELVSKHPRFKSRVVNGQEWDFTHLDAFVFKVPITLPPNVAMTIDVVVLFSNHCFTRAIHPHEVVASDCIFEDDREKRALDRERYELSKRHLLPIVRQLPSQRIFIADPSRPNYLTFEILQGVDQKPKQYAVFFQVERDKLRRKRVLLRIESAYILEQPTKRLRQAEKISFGVLLKQAYLKA